MELLQERHFARSQSGASEALERRIPAWRRLLNLKAPTHDPECPENVCRSPTRETQASSRTNTLTGSETSISEGDPSSVFSKESSTLSVATSVAGGSKTPAAEPSSTKAAGLSTTLVQPIFEIEKGVFANPTVKMETGDLENWKQIKIRLQDTIIHTFKPKRGLDPSIALEFMMAGPSRSLLKPAVVLVCCSEPHRKQLKKILRTQKWLSEYKYYCLVLIDKFQTLSGGLAWVEGKAVYVSVPVGSLTACGAPAQLKDLSGAGNPLRFTVGGILIIDGKPFGVTVAHGLQAAPQDKYLGGEELGDDGDSENDGDDTDDGSPFVNFSEAFTDTSSDTLASLVPARRPDGSPSESIQFGLLPPADSTLQVFVQSPRQEVHIGFPCAISARHESLQSLANAPSDHDWALIEIEDPNRWKSNLITMPDGQNQLEVRSFAVQAELGASQVWINAGFSGVRKGWLTDGLVHVQIDRSAFEARQIILDTPLGKENSLNPSPISSTDGQ